MWQRFRIGREVLTATLLSERGTLRDMRLGDGSVVTVSENLLLKPIAQIAEGQAQTKSFADHVIEAIAPFVSMGQPIRAGRTRVLGYDRVGGFLRVTEGGPVRDVAISSAFGIHEVAEVLALEAHRPKLQSLGLLREGAPVLGSFVEAPKNFHVFMKESPFRDVSLIHRGSVCEITGYFKGAAVVEADGERFWVPLEPLSEMEVKHGMKDADYYFNLDADANAIPDPLNSLPSKGALGMKPGSAQPEENWNVTPYLPHVAGQFAPIPELGEETPSLLDPATSPKEVREQYGALFYYNDAVQQGLGEAARKLFECQGVDAEAEAVLHEVRVDLMEDGNAEAQLELLTTPRSDPETVRSEFISRHTEVYGRAPEGALVDQIVGAARA